MSQIMNRISNLLRIITSYIQFHESQIKIFLRNWGLGTVEIITFGCAHHMSLVHFTPNELVAVLFKSSKMEHY